MTLYCEADCCRFICDHAFWFGLFAALVLLSFATLHFPRFQGHSSVDASTAEAFDAIPRAMGQGRRLRR